MKIREIIQITNGKLICGDENLEVEEFERDTRKIKTGDVFVAIKGEKFNGNDFYKEAFENGASACILSEEPKEKMGNIILLLNQAINELSNGEFAISTENILYNKSTKFPKPSKPISASVSSSIPRSLIIFSNFSFVL